jgi:fatty acid desaturase
MRLSHETRIGAVLARTRPVVAALLARFWRGHDQARAEARLAGMAARDEAAVTAGVLAMLFLAAVLAAQFGWLGMALYFLAVVVLVN